MNWLYPLAIDPDEWARLKDIHQLHPDEPIAHFAVRGDSDDDVEPRDAIILLRAGRCGRDSGMTLEEVGAELGITRERVRQIEEMALARFRRAMRLLRLTENDMRPEDYEARHTLH